MPLPVELSYEVVEGASARRTALFLHGILGSGQNLRTAARRFVDASPSWNAWLVDLRGHGRSPKGSPTPSVEAAAGDVLDLVGWISVEAVVGHSFGGKVALEIARRDGERAARLGPAGGSIVEHVVTLDSNPGTREPLTGGDSGLAVIETIRALPPTFPTKAAFIRAVAERHGRAVAQWLALSAEETPGGVRFALDLDEIRALLLDFFARDLWPVVEDPPAGVSVHLVIAERSSSYSPADRERALAAAARNPRVTVDVLPADHWVHVDDPDGVQRVLMSRLEHGDAS